MNTYSEKYNRSTKHVKCVFDVRTYWTKLYNKLRTAFV